MKNRTSIILLLVSFLTPVLCLAQETHPHHHHHNHPYHHHNISQLPMIKWKFYAGIGGTTYAGEVTGRRLGGGNSLLKSIEPRFSMSVGAGYRLHDHIWIKSELGYNRIKAVENVETSLKRGPDATVYYFKANNVDFAVFGHFNVLPYTFLLSKPIVPYAVVGLGVTSNRPLVKSQGEWKSLKDLSNGQVKNKMLVTLPFGAGFMYRMNCMLDIGLEATVRYTLGGSLDGDSPDGIKTDNLSEEGKEFFDKAYYPNRSTVLKDNPKFNDLYSSMQFRITYTMIAPKYRHLFMQKNINDADGGAHHHLLRMHKYK